MIIASLQYYMGGSDASAEAKKALLALGLENAPEHLTMAAPIKTTPVRIGQHEKGGSRTGCKINRIWIPLWQGERSRFTIILATNGLFRPNESQNHP